MWRSHYVGGVKEEVGVGGLGVTTLVGLAAGLAGLKLYLAATRIKHR